MDPYDDILRVPRISDEGDEVSFRKRPTRLVPLDLSIGRRMSDLSRLVAGCPHAMYGPLLSLTTRCACRPVDLPFLGGACCTMTQSPTANAILQPQLNFRLLTSNPRKAEKAQQTLVGFCLLLRRHVASHLELPPASGLLRVQAFKILTFHSVDPQ